MEVKSKAEKSFFINIAAFFYKKNNEDYINKIYLKVIFIFLKFNLSRVK